MKRITNDTEIEAYIFGPVLSAGNLYVDIHTRVQGKSKIELIKSGIRGLSPALRIKNFVCSVCAEDFQFLKIGFSNFSYSPYYL